MRILHKWFSVAEGFILNESIINRVSNAHDGYIRNTTLSQPPYIPTGSWTEVSSRPRDSPSLLDKNDQFVLGTICFILGTNKTLTSLTRDDLIVDKYSNRPEYTGCTQGASAIQFILLLYLDLTDIYNPVNNLVLLGWNALIPVRSRWSGSYLCTSLAE